MTRQRGLSGSVEAVVLVPLTLGVMFMLLQWALVSWAQATAQGAAHHAAMLAAGLGASESDARAAGQEAAANGSLSGVSVMVSGGPRDTVATVSGRAVTVLWPSEITATAHVPTERLTGS